MGPRRESIDMAVFAAVPEYVRVSLRLFGLASANNAAAASLLARAWTAGVPDPAEPSFARWRRCYEAVGLESGVVPPHEALAAWACSSRGVPSQGALNDVAHSFSLQRRLPVAVYDAAAVSGDLWLGPARGLETYVPLADGVTEVPPPGELILADSAGNVFARAWHGAQGRMSHAGPDTREAIVHLDLLPPHALQAGSLAEAFTRLVKGFVGGGVETRMLTWDTPSVRWDAAP